MAVVSRPLLLSSSKMENELSDAVARFVLEAGGIEQGMYLGIWYIHLHPLNL